MSLKSVYLPDLVIEGTQIRLTGDEHHHLSVNRVQAGETIEIFNGKGTVWTAVVSSHNRRETVANITHDRLAASEPDELILGLSLIRASAFELALEKVVEAGVSRIIPIVTARSNVAPGKRDARWSRIIIEAAKQSKRYYLPRLDPPIPFEDILGVQASSRIMFAERRGSSLKAVLRGSPVLFVVGPEGGWTDTELDKAQHAGFSLVDLGPAILRTETAAIIGTGLIRYELRSR